MGTSLHADGDEENLLLPNAKVFTKIHRQWLIRIRNSLFALLVGFCLGCVAAWYTSGGRTSSREMLYAMNFLVVGDWGRDGLYNQSLVAAQMGRVAADLDIDFVVSTGDNFYQKGLKDVEDPKFSASFTNIYTAPSLQTRWYTVLGNHDYMGDVLAQLDPALQDRDPRWFCQREFQLQFSLCGLHRRGPNCDSYVEFFFIDTTPYVNEYWDEGVSETYDWRGLVSQKEQIHYQLQNLTRLLKRSSATWKIVVGHHPIFSLGNHGDTTELVDQMLPILEEMKVDMYINGHDHCLQHLKPLNSNIHYLTSGGGSKSWQGLRTPLARDGALLAYDGQGFLAISIGPRSLFLSFHDALGNMLHTGYLEK